MRWILRALLVVMVIAASAAAWVVSGLGRGPKVDGTLQFAGLAEPVQVLRDGNGIPYIFANNTADLIRAQGFVTAQARIFQMEAYRALAYGRLAEAIGEGGLKSDREMRTVGLARNGLRHAQRLSPAAREFLGWYAQGINAYVEGHADDLPLELKLAGFRAGPWSVQDMVVVQHFINWSQAANYKGELAMQQVIDKVGPARAAELFPLPHNPDRKQPLPALAQSSVPLRLGAGATALAAAGAIDLHAPVAPLAVGSNNWAIAPARAASGAAVLVNDPHLDSRILPGIWFPVGLFSPQVRAVGAALPAVPGILVGRNAQVAFGVTNAYGDSQDLFVEQVAPGRPDHYVDGDQVRPFETVVELIRIKDAQAAGGMREEKLTVRRTVRGPIVGQSSPAGTGGAGERLLSLRTVAAELPGGELGIDSLLRAGNAAEVDAAVQKIEVMYFNFVFADKAGVIGHRASGRVPVRRSGPGIHPKAVGGEDEWVGTIPAGEMPGQMSPARGWVATANHDTRPDGYRHEYSTFFSPSYRYERIAQVLDAGRAMTTADQRRLMMDIHNLQVPRLMPALLAALKSDPAQADLVAILSAWDGQERAEQAAPLIYRHLYHQVAYETLVDELGDEATRAYLAQWYVWQSRFDELVKTSDAHWFDDKRTPAVETLADIIRRAARSVREELGARHGADPKSWRWGAEHQLKFDSPLRRAGAGRDFLGRGAMPYDGSNETVMRALTIGFKAGHEAQVVASMRIVADLADEQKVDAVVSGGVVERQFHPHQKNQIDAWWAGELLPWWFDRQAIERAARQRQMLMPAGR